MWDKAIDSRDEEQDGAVIEINIVTGGQWVRPGLLDDEPKIINSTKTYITIFSDTMPSNI